MLPASGALRARTLDHKSCKLWCGVPDDLGLLEDLVGHPVLKLKRVERVELVQIDLKGGHVGLVIDSQHKLLALGDLEESRFIVRIRLEHVGDGHDLSRDVQLDLHDNLILVVHENDTGIAQDRD